MSHTRQLHSPEGKRDSDLSIKGFLTKKSSGIFGGSNSR